METKRPFESTRFIYIQEALAIGILGSFAKVLFPGFPVIELYGFIGPIIMIAFGIKTWSDIKENGKEKE